MTSEEFKKHILPLQSAMQTLAERLLGNPDDVADTVQDVFITLWNKRNDLDTVINLQSYCLQSVRLHCIDLLRKRKNDEKRILELKVITDQEIINEVNETEQRSTLLHQLLDELPDKQRQIIQLKYFENYDTSQIEKKLGMTPANIYTTLSRTLQNLRDKLNTLTI
ncbi:MAG: sigma-70 family RNA polymerase sigma factor [Bacteroidales bacterium]|nr:sigma-70 family RNA polymerase sigma factor [Bacteroidales bacterium]